MRDELDKKINAILDCPGCDKRDQRNKELEADVSKLGQLHIDECNLTHKQNVTIRKLEAENTRLRKALKTAKDSMLKYIDDDKALVYAEASRQVVAIDQALAPHPAKEGE